MAKFSQLIAGTRDRKTVDLPLIDGRTVPVDLRVLTPLETITVLEGAAKRTTARGGIAEDGNPIYDLALQVETLFLACVDHESAPAAPTPFFDSPDHILESELMTREAIAHLFALYEVRADEMSLGPRQLDEREIMLLIESSAEGDLVPFSRLRPGVQWSFVRSMASLLRALPRARSSSGSASAPPASEPPKPPDEDVNHSDENQATPAAG